jgi:hypothetical protein
MYDHFRTIIRDVDEVLARRAVESARAGSSFIHFAAALRNHTSHSDADLCAAFAAALLDENSPALTPRQGQALFDALEVQPLRWECPDDGCHARAFLACDELLSAWGVAPTVIGRAWLLSTHPAAWGFEVEDRSGGIHSWSQHTAPTVQVQSDPDPTVLDPTLFSSPIPLATWAARFNMPGTSTVHRPATPAPVPAAIHHYLERILQGGQSAFNLLSPQMRLRLWAESQARQRLLAAGIAPLAEPSLPETRPPRLLTFVEGLTEPYHAACIRCGQQGCDGLVVHTRFRQRPFPDVPWATVAHPDFLRLYPGVAATDLARLYLAALRR